MENNPLSSLLGLLMLLQLAVVLMVLLGGLYALYCLNRAASGLDRLATSIENWVTQSVRAQAQSVALTEAQNHPLPMQVSTENPDWLKPIELPNTIPASNQPAEVLSPTPSAPDESSESEVRRD